MRFAAYADEKGEGLAASFDGNELRGLPESEIGGLFGLLNDGGAALRAAHDRLASAPLLDPAKVRLLPPVRRPGKIICIGLNYADHSAESGFDKVPDYPTVFGRFSTGLIGSEAPMVRPRISDELDFEGELAVIIGTHARHVTKADALSYVAGYSIFNDGSIRNYQFKAPQWTVGKNFDNTGAFGPVFVSSDELPAGGSGLRIETRLNGEVVQHSSTDKLVFDVASLVSILSEAMTLEPGDVIATGTPAGVGLARTPKLWMKPGDICEVEIEGIGVLRNPVIGEDD